MLEIIWMKEQLNLGCVWMVMLAGYHFHEGVAWLANFLGSWPNFRHIKIVTKFSGHGQIVLA